MIDARPCATVILDTYNQAHYIDEAVTSVLAQEQLPGPLEIIIVDDGSDDGTADRLRSYSDHAHVIRKANGGQASALNVGLSRASSDIIMLLDGDDFWHPGKARRVLDLFAQHPQASVVHHGFDFVGAGSAGAYQGKLPLPGGRLVDRAEALLQYRASPASALSFRCSRIAPLLPVPSALWFMADGYLAYLAPFCGDVVPTGDRLAVFRFHEDNLFSFGDASLSKQARKWVMARALHRHLGEWLASNGCDTSSSPVREYLRSHELFADELFFVLQSPGRLSWTRHNVMRISVERHYQPPGYVVFRGLIAVLGAALGYERSVTIQKLYLHSRLVTAARRRWMPTALDRAPAGSASDGTLRDARWADLQFR